VPNFLDTGPFEKLLAAIARGQLPPEVLSETLLSPVTAFECAQYKRTLPIIRENAAHLRPMRSRFVRNPETWDDFLLALAKESTAYFAGMLNALHAQCVMHPPFLAFHLSRYGKNPPKAIAGSQRFTSDVRDSMQLIFAQEIPFITADIDLRRKSSPMLRCQIIHTDPDVNCIIGAIALVNRGWLTADKVGMS
jgi:hypothetical protein